MSHSNAIKNNLKFLSQNLFSESVYSGFIYFQFDYSEICYKMLLCRKINRLFKHKNDHVFLIDDTCTRLDGRDENMKAK